MMPVWKQRLHVVPGEWKQLGKRSDDAACKGGGCAFSLVEPPVIRQPLLARWFCAR